MSTLVMEQRKRIHPHKFTLWVAIASITMMFAGLTSAYIVKKEPGVTGWILICQLRSGTVQRQLF